MARLSKYTREVRDALGCAREEAVRLRHRLIGTEHLLLGMLKLSDPLVEGLFVSLHSSPANISQALDFVIGRGRRALVGEPVLGVTARATLARAEAAASIAQSAKVGLEHVLLGMFEERDGIVMGVLESFGIYPDAACQQLEALVVDGYEHLISSMKYREWYDATPILNTVSRDLTLAAVEGKLDPLIGREEELTRTIQILSRRSKNNPVLIGPAGVGKTAVAEGLAWRIVRGLVPDNLLNCRLVALDIGLLTFGTKFRGDFEERLKTIMLEVTRQPDVVIVIDELPALVHTGVAEGSLDAASLFKPLLARGEFRCIGVTTLEEYRKNIEADPALERRFQPVLIRETAPAETIHILYGLRSCYEDFHHVSIQDEALQAALHLSTRYIHNRSQPDKALDLIDEAASRACVVRSMAPDTVQQLRAEVRKLQQEKEVAIALHDFPRAAELLRSEHRLQRELTQAEEDWQCQHQIHRPVVCAQDIAEIVAARTGIPVARITQEEKLHLLNLENELHQRIVGQNEAVNVVARAIRRARAHIRDMRRPIGAFLFVGPTGVGKTEVARALAASLFGNEQALLKLDMSEFMAHHQVSRLIGSPPGYVGHDQAGQLTEFVRRQPYSIVLFDEIEKAHPQILDLLLQITEDGCLTDAHGQSVSFQHTIIIITSNLGTEHRASGLTLLPVKHVDEEQRRANNHKQTSAHVLDAVRRALRPELFNRLDEVVVFHALHMEHLYAIADLMIEQTRQQLAKQDLTLHVSTRARELLVTRGYDPDYGARLLRRIIQGMLEDLLAEAILQRKILVGDTIEVDVVDNALCMHIATCQDQPAA
ncbi:MAG TPA: ATP-dependent Clp protease ATP-binding subunit [Ktedonobacteraceae bacterium]|jgi:ATP-dependent Clp protease ATP-binding subunit ClpC|nr:ATP-dependent Clp protease ATP-binding subunit [Ktedonobacteraceae bacterium]